MAKKHLDDVAASVYLDKGRDVADTRWLLNKARISTPSGRKKRQSREVAEAVLRHDQRERDRLEKHAGN
ncbi:hypothetical protein [Candidatus Poriferisocius sp.]|uniref:hypothetical protein n=1 Tax=Candidatus Poriferisocius sp. TaxID=3101276 RepID=UPI003B0102DD